MLHIHAKAQRRRLKSSDPDIIMTYGMKYTRQFKKLDECKKLKVHFLCDYIPAIPRLKFPGYDVQYNSLLNRDNYDVIFCLTKRARDKCSETGLSAKFYYLPFGIEPLIFNPIEGVDRQFDVGTMFNFHTVYPHRAEVQDALIKSGLRLLKRNLYHNKYVYGLNQCKVMVLSLNYWKSFGMRILEAMACGTMVITEKPGDAKAMGLVNEKNVVYYDDIDDMLSKVNYFVRQTDERNAIATEALKLVREKHTNEQRVNQMSVMLGRHI